MKFKQASLAGVVVAGVLGGTALLPNDPCGDCYGVATPWAVTETVGTDLVVSIGEPVTVRLANMSDTQITVIYSATNQKLSLAAGNTLVITSDIVKVGSTSGGAGNASGFYQFVHDHSEQAD